MLFTPKRRTGKIEADERERAIKMIVEQLRDQEFAEAQERYNNRQQIASDVPGYDPEKHELVFEYMVIGTDGNSYWEYGRPRKKEKS